VSRFNRCTIPPAMLPYKPITGATNYHIKSTSSSTQLGARNHTKISRFYPRGVEARVRRYAALKKLSSLMIVAVIASHVNNFVRLWLARRAASLTEMDPHCGPVALHRDSIRYSTVQLPLLSLLLPLRLYNSN
jgi:hypothetical protein